MSKKKKTYTKPTIAMVAMDMNPILAAGSIQADRGHETEEAYSKEHAEYGGSLWEDETSDE